MIVGVPKEIKEQEHRVAVVPEGVRELVIHGHRVVVETGAGSGIDVDDDAYRVMGAEIAPNAEAVWEKAELICKVKEPLPVEWPLLCADHTVFTFFHFASNRALTEAMIASHAMCIAYETVEDIDGRHPLLMPMSEIAGRLSVQEGARYLDTFHGGRGVLLGGATGVEPGHVMVIGAGAVGTNAACIAAGMGARVALLDVNETRLRILRPQLPPNVEPMLATEENILTQLETSDLVIGGVYLNGARTPHVLLRRHLEHAQHRAVFVDVAIDQGGCFESSRPTTHAEPIFIESDVIHYCVTNMPAAVARTSTLALTRATFPYLARLANDGACKTLAADPHFARGLNIANGHVIHPAVAKAFDLAPTSMEDAFD